MTTVTRDELVEKLLALPGRDREFVVQKLLASFPELDQDGLKPEERAELDAELDRACEEADRGDTVSAESVLSKLGK